MRTRKRQSSKRTKRNANSPKKEEPPDVMILGWGDIFYEKKLILEEIIKRNLTNLDILKKCSEKICLVENEIQGHEQSYLNQHIQRFSTMGEFEKLVKQTKKEVKGLKKLLQRPEVDSEILKNMLTQSILRKKAFLRGVNPKEIIMISNSREESKFYEHEKARAHAKRILTEEGFTLQM